jgi:hypothetical protein
LPAQLQNPRSGGRQPPEWPAPDSPPAAESGATSLLPGPGGGPGAGGVSPQGQLQLKRCSG